MRFSVWSIILSVSVAIAMSSPGSAHQVVIGKLKIGHPWVHEAPEGAPGTYSCIIEIHNDGDEPDRLLGATIEGAGKGVLYKLTETNGHFTSQPFDEGLVIPAHGSVELAPTSYQFKFGKITKALTADTMANGTLVFEKLDSVPVEFMIEEDDTAPKEDAPLATGQARSGSGEMEQMRSMMHEILTTIASHADERIAALKTELKITEAQLPQWNSFADALRSAAKSVETILHETMESAAVKPAPIYGGERSYPDAGAIKKTGGPVPEEKGAQGETTQVGAFGGLPAQLKDREIRLTEYLARLKAVKAALDPLYASFGAEQKKIADGLMVGPMGVM